MLFLVRQVVIVVLCLVVCLVRALGEVDGSDVTLFPPVLSFILAAGIGVTLWVAESSN